MSRARRELAAIRNRLATCQRVLVASHLRPDGDALGSTIAFALWLREQGKEVTAWNEDGVPEKFHYLPEHDIVAPPSREKQNFDAVVALDTSVKNRLGKVLDSIGEVGVWINMDHHITNERFADINYIDPKSPATGQIVYDFLEAAAFPVTRGIAANLFAAISTDTGSFQYQNTTARTFEVAAHLVSAGVEVGPLSQQMYESQPRRRFDLLRLALNSAHFSPDGRIASFSLTMAEVDRLGALPEDNEGIIDHLRSIEGVVAAIFFEEMPEGRVRISMRSKNPAVSAADLCGLFGGGGHTLAAGARVRGQLKEVRERFLEEVTNAIGKLN